MQSTVPVLLRKALHRCNARGTSIAVTVVLVGLIMAGMQLFAPKMMLEQLVPALPPLLGESKTAQIESDLALARPGTGEAERMGLEIVTAIQNASDALPENERTTTVMKMSPALASLIGWMVLFGLVILAVEAGSRIAGYVIAGKNTPGPLTILGLIPRFLILWLLMAILTGTWVSVILLGIGFIVPGLLPVLSVFALMIPLLLLPRFAIAPALLTDGHGILRSLKLSWQKSQNRYGKILTALIGMQVTVYILERLAEIGAGYAILAASDISPYAPVIAFVLPFLHAVGIVYRCAFVTVLAEELK